MINAQINHSLKMMGIDPEMHISAIGMEAGETLEIFLVLHRLKGEIAHRTILTTNEELVNLTIVLSADLTINRRVVSDLTNRNFRKTSTRRHRMWSALLQPMIPLLGYQIFAR